VASGPAVLASPGASLANLANISSVIRDYLGTGISHLSSAAATSSDYLQSNTGLPPSALYGSLATALLLGAFPIVLARQKRANPEEPQQKKKKKKKAKKAVKRKKRL